MHVHDCFRTSVRASAKLLLLLGIQWDNGVDFVDFKKLAGRFFRTFDWNVPK